MPPTSPTSWRCSCCRGSCHERLQAHVPDVFPRPRATKGHLPAKDPTPLSLGSFLHFRRGLQLLLEPLCWSRRCREQLIRKRLSVYP